jgi:protocatechuate 3,4-dioxygenase beta subunit
MPRLRIRWLAVAGGLVLAASAAVAVPAHADDPTGTLLGTLTNDGVPVTTANVQLLDSNGNVVGFTNTDSTGSYGFAVPAGSYKIGYFLADGYSQYAHGQLSFDTADQFAVDAGATTTVDETILPHGVLSGHLTDANGAPVAGAFVDADPPDGSPNTYSVTTDSTGFYDFDAIPAGDYIVSFQKDFRSPTQYANNETSFSSADVIHVATGVTTTLDQSLLPTGTVAGTLTDHGQPVIGASVNIFAPDGQGSFTSTDDNGAFTAAVLPDTYTVQFGLPDGRSQYAHNTPNFNNAQPVVVTAGATTTLTESVAPSGTVSGRLIDSDGNPVADASISMVSNNNAKSAFGFTDDTGAYSMPAYDGTYRLSYDTSIGNQYFNNQTEPDQATPVTVTTDTTTTANDQLPVPGSISVTAINATTQAPVQSFCVFVSLIAQSVCTDNGTALVPQALPGQFEVSVDTDSDSGFANVAVASGQTTPVTISLIDPSTVTTTIVDAKTGAPVANACLHLVDVTAPSSLGQGGLCSGPDGTINNSYPAATYKGFVSVNDGVHGDQWVGPTGGVGQFKRAISFTLSSGTNTAIPTIKLDRAGTISGTITDAASGLPVPESFAALASVSGANGGGGLTANADGSGHYTMSNLGPYNWTLFFAGAGEASVFSGGVPNRDKATTIKVRAGQTTTYNIGLTPGTTVTGKVTLADGTRVKVGDVEVFNADTGEDLGRSDITGSPAVYTLHVAGRQRVRLLYSAQVRGTTFFGFSGGSGDTASATVYTIPPQGVRTINITATRRI